jgi:zinc transporter ZupT
VLEASIANLSPLPDLLAVIGAGATVVGGIVGLLSGGASISRQSLENLALGTTVGGFAGCLVTFLIYLSVRVAGV